jgi:segregation and condensation protein A
MAEPETYRVKLETFEGPLDLLLYLIRKNEVDIYDIPVALIVEQYMGYLDLMRALNLDVAGDFIVMAATLSHLKSQLLLPRTDEAVADEEGEDPRAELVRRLLEYQRFKEAAAGLMERAVLGRDVFVRAPSQELIEEAAQAAGISPVTFAEVGVFELLTAFKEVMERAKVTDWHEVTMERVSIMDRINDILGLLREADTLAFDRLFTSVTDKGMIIATFLALLELVRLKVIKAHQERPLGPIHLVRAVTIDDQWLSENLPHLDRSME